MRRRDFITLFGATAALWPLAAQAQQPNRVRRIGLIMSYKQGDLEGERREAAFRQGLRDSGWVDGQNARIDVRWFDGDPERAKGLARDLVDQTPDVIVVNGTPSLAAIRQLTNSIPVVFIVITNPVGAGFVQSLAQPGGNITGFSTFEPEIGGKWLEMLKEVAPAVSRIGVLYDPGFTGFLDLWKAIEAIAPKFGASASPIHARDGDEIDAGITAFAQQTGGGLIVLPTPINSVQRQRIFGLAEKHRLPAMYPFAFHARTGGLIAYGFDSIDLFSRAGPYVARILSGEKPGDLPVQAPVKFELAVNLKTAKTLGLTVPPTLLARADEVIE